MTKSLSRSDLLQPSLSRVTRPAPSRLPSSRPPTGFCRLPSYCPRKGSSDTVPQDGPLLRLRSVLPHRRRHDGSRCRRSERCTPSLSTASTRTGAEAALGTAVSMMTGDIWPHWKRRQLKALLSNKSELCGAWHRDAVVAADLRCVCEASPCMQPHSDYSAARSCS